MKVKIKIPESLSEITLRQYQKYMRFHNESDDVNMQNLKMVEYFCGLKLSDVNQIRLTDFNDILKKLNDAFNQKRRLKTRFELHGKEWGMIPDLEEMSFGEYIDLNTYISDYSTLHNYMAVFYRPITNRKKDMYLIEDYEGSDKYASLMLDAPLDVVLEAQLFFYRLGIELLKDIPVSMSNQERKELEQVMEKNGVGIPKFIRSLVEIDLDSMTLQN